MTTSKNDLEHYEATEAKEIVRLLEKMGRPQAECAPPSFQAKVLARLEEKRANRNRFSWAFRYQAPMALAAGLVLGIALAPRFLSQEIEQPLPATLDDPIHLRGPNGVPGSPIVTAPQEVAPDSSDEHQSPEQWLESIALLLMTGQVSNAHQQLEAFRRQYPGYEQDSENP